MTLKEAMSRLESLGNDKVRDLNIRNGAGENQFGVKLGDLRVVAKEIKIDNALAKELWKTDNLDARLLAILILKPKDLTADELDAMVRSNSVAQVSDWLSSYVIKLHPEKEALRQKWMSEDNPSVLRAGWSLTAERAEKSPEGLDVLALLDRIEKEMKDAHELPKWTMNYALANIGINFPEHRARAMAIGEKLGVYRDYPVSKGCTSPFAPIWINYFVERQ